MLPAAPDRRLRRIVVDNSLLLGAGSLSWAALFLGGFHPALAGTWAVLTGLLAGVGFTVALFFTTAAFPEGGRLLEDAKMGALLSFAAAPVAILLARVLRVGSVAA